MALQVIGRLLARPGGVISICTSEWSGNASRGASMKDATPAKAR